MPPAARLHQLAGIADDLGPAHARPFRYPVRHEAVGERSRSPLLLERRSVGAQWPERRRPVVRHGAWCGTPPAVSDLSGGAAATSMTARRASATALSTTNGCRLLRRRHGRWLLQFSADRKDVPTATVGIVEPGIGDALPTAQPDVPRGAERLSQAAGISTPATTTSSATDGQSYSDGNRGERSLDVGVVASATPGSTMGLYSGSGFTRSSHANGFTSFQSGVLGHWSNNPPSSRPRSRSSSRPRRARYSPTRSRSSSSTALRNITMVQANNDFGLGLGDRDRPRKSDINSSSPYMLLVGGTSLTTLAAATAIHDRDRSIHGASVYGRRWPAILATLWRLVEGGLTRLPLAPQRHRRPTRTSSSNRCGIPASSCRSMRSRSSAPATAASTHPSPRRGTRAVRLDPDQRQPGPRDRPRGAGRLGRFRRQHVLPAPGKRHDRVGACRGNQCGDAAVGLADCADRHNFQRPGAAESRLRQRPLVHRRCDRAGVVQRHHLRQQRHVLHQRRTGARSSIPTAIPSHSPAAATSPAPATT